MDGSGTIRVVKRDGTKEAFDAGKLAGAIFRAMQETAGRLDEAWQLALAIGIYLQRTGWDCISSAAIFEMSVKVLRRSGLSSAAGALETCQSRRHEGRKRLHVCHDDGKTTFWDKSWLSQLAERSWFLSRTTARIVAGEVERQLLGGGPAVVSRRDILDMLNERVAQYGLADAVPVRLSAGE